ncbi:MAG TPA: beta-phosphoglucomutase [Chitinophagaceae bacterium]|nr:beta-phosphoglucomutase [Chitinophagaceae bacterium]
MKIRACIFDLDGVIVDTAQYHFQSWKKIADQLGIQFSELENEHLKGVSRMQSLDFILNLGNRQIDQVYKEELAGEKNAGYLDFIKALSPQDVFTGVRPLLEDLKKNHVRIALGSSSRNARLILGKLGLLGYFNIVVDGNDVKAAKPDPEIFLNAASKLGVKPEDTVIFEDAIAGTEAAFQGGFRCVGIGSSELLVKATLVLPSLEGLTFSKLKRLLDQY